MRNFSASVLVSVKKGMKVRINPKSTDGIRSEGKQFIVDGEPYDLCGTEVVPLINIDGSPFSSAYQLDMLQVTDTFI